MTFPYLCHGQQSFCYLLIEEGSQEVDERCEIAQPYNPLSKAGHCGFSLSAADSEEKWGAERDLLVGHWGLAPPL